MDRCELGFGWRDSRPPHSLGEPLLLLHGLTGSRLSWEPQLVSLSASRVVAAWDLPGYGDSSALSGPASFESLAAAVVRWADAVGASERFHLAGLSFGGMIAQYVAALHPDRVRSLSLLSTSPKFGLDGTSPAAWRAARLAALDAGKEPADFAPVVLSAIAGPSISASALAEQVDAAKRVPSAGLRVSIDVLITHDTRHLLAGITAPTLCMVGALDQETPVAYASYLAEHIPGASLNVIEGAGHLLNAEAPGVVNELLARHMHKAEEQAP